MELIKFRLQNYKRYKDTGWIDVGQLNAFVGKNESGKSALFQGLAKLNPSDGLQYDEFRELPRRLLNELRDKHVPVCSAVFHLDLGEQKVVKNSYKKYKITEVEITRNYNNEYTVRFPEINKNSNETLTEYLVSEMPQFLYFDNYDILDSAINIPEYLNKLQSDPQNRKLRVKSCLFKHVKLSAEELRDLDPTGAEVTDEEGQRLTEQRSALCNAAQTTMTQKFSNWWLQRRHSFHYNIDSKFFHIEISDDIDSSPIILEERSMGMRYFFSFYLIFLVEAEESHKNSIILLDEPGLHYHGSMQTALLQFFKKLSGKNQLFYSTHSPFLVDSTNLDSIKTIFEDSETGFSHVAETESWPRDNDALFPIRVGWWYDVFSSYILNKIHLVLEGQSDVEIFNAMNDLLDRTNKQTLSPNILCVPGGGSKTTHLVALLRAYKAKIILFQDGDNSGKNRARDIKKNYHIPYSLTSDFCSINNSSIEDLFPRGFYLDAVKSAYSDIELTLENITPNESIIKSLKSIFESNAIQLDKLKIANHLIKQLDNAPEIVITTFEKIFTKINELNAKLND